MRGLGGGEVPVCLPYRCTLHVLAVFCRTVDRKSTLHVLSVFCRAVDRKSAPSEMRAEEERGANTKTFTNDQVLNFYK